MPSGLIIEPGSSQSAWSWRRLWVADDCSAVLALSSEPEPLKFWLWASNSLVVNPPPPTHPFQLASQPASHPARSIVSAEGPETLSFASASCSHSCLIFLWF